MGKTKEKLRFSQISENRSANAFGELWKFSGSVPGTSRNSPEAARCPQNRSRSIPEASQKRSGSRLGGSGSTPGASKNFLKPPSWENMSFFRPAVATNVFVLSLDIVLHPQLGDLTNPKATALWQDLMFLGVVFFVLAGTPCETWSAARFHKLSRMGHMAHALVAAGVAMIVFAKPAKPAIDNT